MPPAPLPGAPGDPARPVGSLGELALVRAISERFPQGPGVLLGPGDDAAIVAAPDGRVLATTDVLVEGVHFRRDWSSAYDIGRKAAAQSLADIAAMGGRATALLVGLSVPSSLPSNWALELADGLRDEAAVLGASIIGGDVVSSPVIQIAVTALGNLGGRPPVTRTGAKPGDVVCLVTGPYPLGSSAAGLALLLAREDDDAVPEVVAARERTYALLLSAHRRPVPPYGAGAALAAAGATAMLDVSDGLLNDLAHLARASGVSFEVDPSGLAADARALAPLAAALEDEVWAWVLTGGEDHALVATLPATAPRPDGVSVIGRVAGRGLPGRGGVHVMGMHLPARLGFQHFADSEESAMRSEPVIE